MLCNIAPHLVRSTEILVRYVLPHLEDLVYLSGGFGCLGVTATVAFFSDALSLSTLHVRVCYSLLLFLYRQQLRAADSLWKLFRGEAFPDSSVHM